MYTELKNELLSDLKQELEKEPVFSAEVLERKIENAIKEVVRARRYPKDYTVEKIKNDVSEYYSNIRNIALFDYNQIGSEGQTSHNENGINRSYIDRNKLFSGIIPLARF